MLTGPRITAVLSTVTAISATAISSFTFGFDILPALGIGAGAAITTFAAGKSLSLVNLLETFLTRMNARVLPKAEGSLDAQTRLLSSLTARVEELRHLTQTSRHVDAVAQNMATISREFTQIIERASRYINDQGEVNPELSRNFQEFLQNVNELMGTLNALLNGFAPARGLGMPPAMAINPFAAMFGGAPGANAMPMFGGPGGGNPLAALFAELGRGGAPDDSDDEAAPRDPDPARENAGRPEARAAEGAPEARVAEAAPEARVVEGAPEARVAEAAPARAAEGAPEARAVEAAVVKEVEVSASPAPVEAVANCLNEAPAPVVIRREEAASPLTNSELRKDAPSESTETSVKRRRRSNKN